MLYVKKRAWFLFYVFTFTIIFLMYKGFMPPKPTLVPINSDFLSELTMKLRVNYPEVDKVEGRIFADIFELYVAYNGELEDLKAQEILKIVKNNLYEKNLRKSKYNSISISIFNVYPPYRNSYPYPRYSYRYTTAAPFNNYKSAVTRWTVIKTAIINDKETTWESIFEE
jgi:hypothetical protein